MFCIINYAYTGFVWHLSKKNEKKRAVKEKGKIKFGGFLHFSVELDGKQKGKKKVSSMDGAS